MELIKKHRTVIFSIIIIILLIGTVFLWNFIVDKQKENNAKKEEEINVLDVNNVPNVDAKLNGEDYKITQLYLLSYAKHKSGIWYMSSGYVSKISINETEATIILKEDKNSKVSITATIEASKVNVKVGDTVNFVGTVDIKSGEVHLAKISLDTINYASVTEITLADLYNNIKLVKETYFVVSGYMITEGERYKLFDSKDSYTEDNSVGQYFLIEWEKVLYTGNQKVTLRCNLKDTYILGNCTLVQ